MKKNNGNKFSLTLLQAIGTIFKSFVLVGLLGGIAAMMIGSFIIFKTIETAPELDISKIYATESTVIYDKDGNGYIIQCDSVGNMFLIDGNTGEILNTITLDANVEASPAIYEDMIVVATRAGSIYGIEIE